MGNLERKGTQPATPRGYDGQAKGDFCDGHAGIQSLSHTNEVTLMCVKDNKPSEIINWIAIHRDSFYRELSTFDTFGRGWLRRNDEIREQALEMGRG